MIGMWTWYQSVLLPCNCTLFVRRTWLSTSYVQLTTFLVHLVCFLPPPLPRPFLFLLQNKKAPQIYIWRSVWITFKKIVDRNLLLESFRCDSSLWIVIRFCLNLFKTFCRPFCMHSSKWIQLHLGNIFHCFFFPWNHSWMFMKVSG